MKTQMTFIQSWQMSTVVPSTFVVRTHGFGMGDVCTAPVNLTASTTTKKRHAASAIKATVKGLPPWSPPVT